MARHRHQEFIRFLERHRGRGPGSASIVHAILDNYAAHKHPKVPAVRSTATRGWTFHFVPTSCSSLNAVEELLRHMLSKRRLKRGVFRSIVDLQAAINRFVSEHNTEPKPFVWTADPDRIIAAVKRGHQTFAIRSTRILAACARPRLRLGE